MVTNQVTGRTEIIIDFEGERGEAEKEQQVIALRDWRPEIEGLIKGAKKLQGGSGQPAIYSPVFSLVKASLQLALVGVEESDDADKLYKELQSVSRALKKIEDTIYRM